MGWPAPLPFIFQKNTLEVGRSVSQLRKHCLFFPCVMETDVKFGPSHSVMVKSEARGEQVLPQHSWEPLSAGLGSAFSTLHQEVKPTPMPSAGRLPQRQQCSWEEACGENGGGMRVKFWEQARDYSRLKQGHKQDNLFLYHAFGTDRAVSLGQFCKVRLHCIICCPCWPLCWCFSFSQ